MLADGAVVGRIMWEHGAQKGSHWFWMLMYDQHEVRSPTEGGANSWALKGTVGDARRADEMRAGLPALVALDHRLIVKSLVAFE